MDIQEISLLHSLQNKNGFVELLTCYVYFYIKDRLNNPRTIFDTSFVSDTSLDSDPFHGFRTMKINKNVFLTVRYVTDSKRNSRRYIISFLKRDLNVQGLSGTRNLFRPIEFLNEYGEALLSKEVYAVIWMDKVVNKPPFLTSQTYRCEIADAKFVLPQFDADAVCSYKVKDLNLCEMKTDEEIRCELDILILGIKRMLE